MFEELETARRRRRARPAAVGGSGVALVIAVVLAVVLARGDSHQGLGSVLGLPTMVRVDGSNISVVDPGPDNQQQFLREVVQNIQAYWTQQFAASGRTYEPTTLTLFDAHIPTGCGEADAATGPFYCPADQRVYLDVTFFDELQNQLGAPGDFAEAYVVAHEFGHHVQDLLGISDRADSYVRQGEAQANEVSVALELQADCFAGVWANSTQRQGLLEPGDLEEGLRAAASVGDDVLQRRTQGYVNPETFTHGTAEQRQESFSRGFQTGEPSGCGAQVA